MDITTIAIKAAIMAAVITYILVAIGIVPV